MPIAPWSTILAYVADDLILLTWIVINEQVVEIDLECVRALDVELGRYAIYSILKRHNIRNGLLIIGRVLKVREYRLRLYLDVIGLDLPPIEVVTVEYKREELSNRYGIPSQAGSRKHLHLHALGFANNKEHWAICDLDVLGSLLVEVVLWLEGAGLKEGNSDEVSFESVVIPRYESVVLLQSELVLIKLYLN